MKLTMLVMAALAAPAAAQPAKVRVPLAQVLAPLDGAHLKVSMTEVTYAPGAGSQAHSHPCPVLVYVIEGAVRTQVKGEPEAVYKAGQTFYEAANGVHLIARNASPQAAAKFLAVSVCDHDTPTSVPVPEEKK